ncbi:(Lyso)-N-acylphosphatidylethanolamine lipase-like isoform X2 [Ruditapes philippinarum]|uniref:(Lyso)-N-acylphosphatidylethanolamine lipase-like isoform X2 n=1 Tax=Ruditapes philippinarum TaxID=129788 RepID=UPI00295B822A|nr:(Lyso)-N-acylphosphatidylethanolamine lipase-like isoform X2 [Ruditapes philippinarum]
MDVQKLNQSQVVAEESESWFKWVPTSMSQLVQIEARIFSSLKSAFEKKFVTLPQSQHRIWTVIANKDKPNVPLVMVHGMGGGVGLWAQNIDALAQKRPVYTFDLLGFGRSSRPKLSTSARLVEMEFVESIEEWRQEMKIDKMALLGHSLGAYIVSAYAIKYPEKIQHLFLVDPWGFPDRPKDNDRSRRIPVWVRAVAKVLSPFNPLAVVRASGPWGPGLIKRFRPDLQAKFSHLFDDDTILDYIYHCNAQVPSGETAFKTLSLPLGWAKRPMIQRIADIDKNLPITFIYGSRTWMDRECGNQSRYLRTESRVDVEIIVGAGHHVYADRSENFNKLLNQYLDTMDKHVDNEKLAKVELKRVETDVDLEEYPITQV